MAAGGYHLFEPSVLAVELHAIWAGVTFARQQLHAEKIFLKSDSAIVIS